MKSSVLSIILILTILVVDNTSAHFFPNISSIPHSLIPRNNNTNSSSSPWDTFLKLRGCQYGQKVEGLSKLKQYFHYFGYINSSLSNFNDTFDDYLESAVRIYQQNFKLNTTGQLDTTTLEHIVRPRCGNPDIVNGSTTMKPGPVNNQSQTSHIHTVQHYSFFPGNPRWPEGKTELTYAFLAQLDSPVRQVFANAFQKWSAVTLLNFTETALNSDPDITIGFFTGNHNDGDWVTRRRKMQLCNSPASAFDLESVAVHEIGHLLGLGHSSEEDAIMYPTITTSVRKVELASDDVQGIQQLYGSNPNFNGTLPTLRDVSGSQKLPILFDFDMYKLFVLAGIFQYLLLAENPCYA